MVISLSRQERSGATEIDIGSPILWLSHAHSSWPGHRAGAHHRPLGHRIELCVYVDDVDAAVARLRAARVPIVLEPAEQPWGERVAYVYDPDGNLVMLTR